jgi:hypothetical protein
MVHFILLWHIELLLSGDSVNSGHCNVVHATIEEQLFSVVRVMAIAGQWLGKHVPAALDTNATIEE